MRDYGVNSVAISDDNEFIVSVGSDYKTVLTRLNRLDHVLEYYIKAGETREGYLALANQYFKKGALDSAIEYHDKAESDTDVYIKIADKYLSRYQWKSASEQIGKGVAIYEDMGVLQNNFQNIVEAYYNAKDYDNAGLYSIKMNDVQWILKVADKLFDLRNYERAAYYYEKGGKGDDAYIKIANKALKYRDFDSAAVYLEKAGVISNYYTTLAEGYFNKKAYDKSAYYYEKSDAPEYIYTKLADAFFENSDLESAASYYDKADTSHFVYLKLANAFFDQKEYEMAGKYFIKADAYKTHFQKLSDAYSAIGNNKAAKTYSDMVKEYEKDELRIDLALLQSQAELSQDLSKKAFNKGDLNLSESYLSLSSIYIMRRDIENNSTIKELRSSNEHKYLLSDSLFLPMAKAIDRKLGETMKSGEKNGFIWNADITTIQVEARIHNVNAMLLIYKTLQQKDAGFAAKAGMSDKISNIEKNVDFINREIFKEGVFTRIRGLSNASQRALKYAESSLLELGNL